MAGGGSERERERQAGRGLNVRCGCRGRSSGRDVLDNVDDVEMS